MSGSFAQHGSKGGTSGGPRRNVKPSAKMGKATNVKKEAKRYHKEKYAREQVERRGHHAQQHTAVGNHEGRSHQRSARTKDIDIHLAAKVSSELRSDLSSFKTRLNATNIFGADLSEIFKFVPPPFIQQHLPEDVRSLRSYLSKFERGAPNSVQAFIVWYEWAEYELNKGKGRGGGTKKHYDNKAQGLTSGDEEEEAAAASDQKDGEQVETHGKVSRSRAVLAKNVKEREHVRALLQMCLRHNSTRRKEGQHSLINHLKAKLVDGVDCRSLKSMRDTAHHALPYALSRMLLGMVTEDMAMIVLHAHILFLALRETDITPSIVLSLIGEEIALDARLKVTKARLEARAARRDTQGEQQKEDQGDWDDFDPDTINDPTRGERNQRIVAAVFAMGAVVANRGKMRVEDARHAAQYLCFAYVEQKATRVMTAALLLITLQKFPKLWEDESVMEWISYAFFLYPKLEYFRPEGVQLLLRLMAMETKPPAIKKFLPTTVQKYAAMDPLEPTTVEQIANALFRKEQVIAVYPMVHPVWDDWFDLLVQRCAAGESLQEHLSTMMHNAIAPYRRGNSDIPRRALFQQLVARLGQLVVKNDDADQRQEMLKIASQAVGYGRKIVAKASDPNELRMMPLEMLDAKVRDLIKQYFCIRDSDPSAHANRTWVLRELRACLSVPLREGVTCTYVDEAVRALLRFGFYPTPKSSDEKCMNRAIYLFSDVFSFTYTAALSRPKCTLSALSVIRDYLAAEEKGITRYTTGATERNFRKARNCIVEALESSSTRSVLFYEERDIHVLLVLLFLILSTDDPSNEEAKNLANSTVPDLCQFFRTGTLETLDLFYDVLMALVMRPSSALHVLPLMVCVRRIATGYLLRFARYVRERPTLDLVLAPLREAYHTDDRELIRQAKAKGVAAEAEDSSADEEEGDEEDENNEGTQVDEKDEDEEDEGGDVPSEDEADKTETETETEADESEEPTEEDEATEPEEGADEEQLNPDVEDEESDTGDEEEEEAPTQQYIDALKGMIGNVDLQFVYPTDTANKEKGDVVRAIQVATRVGVAMRSPLTVHIFQVLLAVCRENVKAADDVIFNSTVSSLQMLMMTKNRYFGRFLVAESLFQLLSDIQSYCRKLDRVLVNKESRSARHALVVRRRMTRLKDVALRVFHFIAFLAHKNHAGEDVRVTLMEFYKSIFCDRGWDGKKRMPSVKRDMHHYRHGFAWALLPAALEKFSEVEVLEGPQRVRVFQGCCQMVEAVLPRLSGLGATLRASAASAISSFLQSVTPTSVYNMKYTLLYDYLHCLKMVLKYNSRVQLDTAWASNIVKEVVDDDSLMTSAATIRLLAAMENLLNLTPRARETKAPSPVSVLYKQYEKSGRKEKAAFYRRAKRVRKKVVRALAAHRNGELTDEEKAAKRRRRETLRINDRLERQMIRTERSQILTKEEREEKRKRIMVAKQERIAKNRERKRRLHEQREKAFQRWREQKLAAAAVADE
ncbi:hypothetical protein, conserved [Trypanosoma brucei brucei TREU927]|uniref:Uncharacterized protein n=1 Tax=Trypanosoma brucei brucei (strain 927/4 GUTat10.1) TaxID=185431 RepID=Q57XQ7_TRYB2|nr:hypothetical protein, conserved [Trypanosoma brucei brucei TREU927]AAX69612.1 hypothetical protein, conserved [Trypanosoma brucei]AAZ12281.1 hypothetical protein, conserved [Trypanosoma brucei brucei TREU927]